MVHRPPGPADRRSQARGDRRQGGRQGAGDHGVQAWSRPITLALVIDASGSMEQKLADTKIAAASFVDQLTPDDRAIVIAFSAEVQVLCKATADKAKLKSAIQSIQVQTSTALYDALALSIDELKAAAGPDGRKAIVILSDGEDSGSGKNTYEAVEKAAITADVRVYSIDITRTSTATNIKALGGSPFAQVSSTTLRGLSDQTGGDAYYVAALIELKDSYAKVADDLRRQYWITYRPSNTKKDGKWREVGVEGKERKLLVKTRAGYYAPTH
ncbi:MAG: VWA domain-containing protein [Acidobacteriota bacterium]